MTNNLPNLLVICGPTATGKTALAIQTALEQNGEIISCDSMQIYCGMDIGTAKASSQEQATVPHHMINVVHPDVDFSAASFAKMALPIVDDILTRDKLPILCGGTGYYIDALLQNNFDMPGENADFRQSLEDITNTELHSRLEKCDPKSAEELHPNDRRRVVRALEIFHVSGQPRSNFQPSSRFNAKKIGLTAQRPALYARGEQRVDEMMAQGLLEEVRALNLCEGTTAAAGIGYRQILAFLQGECTLDTAVSDIKQATRNYMKRQLTYFRRDQGIQWREVRF